MKKRLNGMERQNIALGRFEYNSLVLYYDVTHRGGREEYVGCCSRKEINVIARLKSEILKLKRTHKENCFYIYIMKKLKI
jgi:hypothetical protein